MERRELLWLGAIVTVGAIARFATLDLQSFHHDEAVTAGRVLQPSLGETLDKVGGSERSPPLYYLLAWGWSKIFGLSEIGLRSLSALLGTLAIPAAWLAGRELASARAGLIAGAFVALNPLLVWYSQEARSYALLVLLALLSLALMARAARDPRPWPLSLWALAAALALCSHYFAAFIVVPQAFWLLWAAPAAARRRALLAAGAVVAVGLALLPLARTQEGEGRRNAFADEPLRERALEIATDAFAGEQPEPFAAERGVDLVQGADLAIGLGALFVAGALVGAGGSAHERRGAIGAGAIAGAALVVPLALAVVAIDFVNARNLVGACGPLMVAIAIGLSVRRPRYVGIATAGVLVAAFAGTVLAVTQAERMQRLDWRAAAAAAGTATAGPRVVVVNQNGDDPLKYYLGADDFEKPERVREVVAVSLLGDVGNPPRQLELEREQRVPPFTVRVYRAPRPLRAQPADFAGQELLRESSKVLIDRPG